MPVLVGGLVIGLANARASGEGLIPGPGVRLGVERNSDTLGCPSQQVLTARVEAIMGRSLASLRTVGKGVAILVRFTHESRGYAVSLRFEGERSGERQLRDNERTCDALAEAVSLTVALVIEREALSQAADWPAKSAVSPAPPPASPAPSAVSPAPPPLSPAPSAVSPAPSASTPSTAAPGTGQGSPTRADGSSVAKATARPTAADPWTLGASVAVGPAFGFVADLGWTVEGLVQVRLHHRWEVRLGLHGLWDNPIHADSGAVKTSLGFGSLQTCTGWGKMLRVSPCLAFGLGRLSGEGVGFNENRSADLVWSALGGRLGARASVGKRVSVLLDGSWWVPVRVLTFSARNLGTVVRTPPWAGALTLGIGIDWGGPADSQMTLSPSEL